MIVNMLAQEQRYLPPFSMMSLPAILKEEPILDKPGQSGKKLRGVLSIKKPGPGNSARRAIWFSRSKHHR